MTFADLPAKSGPIMDDYYGYYFFRSEIRVAAELVTLECLAASFYFCEDTCWLGCKFVALFITSALPRSVFASGENIYSYSIYGFR